MGEPVVLVTGGARRVGAAIVRAAHAAGARVVTQMEQYPRLHEVIDQTQRVMVNYFAVAPFLFKSICQGLHQSGILTPEARMVMEKPIGHNLKSSIEINDEVAKVFNEDQVYRIDHYLGKETVQNILVARFANTIFEPLWNRNYIDHVEITVAEKIGVEHRGKFYDKVGILRDIFQNHLLQLLTLVAMEPPVAFEASALRNEKVKVLSAITPMTGAEVTKATVVQQLRAKKKG